MLKRENENIYDFYGTIRSLKLFLGNDKPHLKPNDKVIIKELLLLLNDLLI